MLAALLMTAIAEEPPYVRLSPGVAWLQGNHVGDDSRVGIQGLALQQAVFVGGTFGRCAMGLQLAMQETPWLSVAADERYAARPNLTAGIGTTFHVRFTESGWHGTLTAGFRVPFRLVGREHRSVVETFFGGSVGAGVGYQGRPGPKGWSWGGEVLLEGTRLWSDGNPAGLSYSPELRFWVPTARITLAFGGWE